MAELNEQVGLDISSALEAGDNLAQSIGSAIEAAVSAAVEGMSSQFAGIASDLGDQLAAAASDIPIEADVSGIPAEIESVLGDIEGSVPIDADVAPAQSEIADLTASIDGLDATIEVDADTSAAQAAVEELGASVEGASGGLGSLEGGVSGLNATSGLATGSVAGLGGAIGGLGGGAGLAVGGVAAVAGAASLFFTEAVEATGASQRFTATLGDMASGVENLDSIPGLNTNLSDLALTLGSDDDRVREVAARLYELATASGISADAASEFTQQTIALGARAVALNPNLGDLGDVSDRLSTAFVRGGRFAAQFGLDLNQADINQRALADTGKATATELSFVEKAMAGAALASEKYGGNLSTIVAEGSENAITKQRRLKQTIVENIEALGMPLVAPIFEVMEEGIPVAQEAGRAIAQLAEAGLPVLIAGLQVLVPILELTADVLELLPDELLVGAAAGLVLATSINTVVASVEAGSVGISSAIPLLGAFTASFLITKTVLDTFFGSDAPVDFDAKLAHAEQTAKSLAGVAGTDLVGAFQRLVTQFAAASDIATPVTVRMQAFLAIARNSPADAQRLIDSLKASGVNTHDFEVALDTLLKKQRDQKIASDNSAVANAALAASYRTPTEAAIAFVTALQKQEEIQNRLINAQLGLTGAAINYERAVIGQTKAQEDYNAAVGLFGPNSKEATDAALALRSADLQLVQSTEAVSKAAKELNVDLNDPAAVAGALQHLRDLQAEYPAAAGAIQPYIDKLQTQKELAEFLATLPPVVVNVGVTVEGADTLQKVVDNLNALPEAQRVAAALGFGGAVGGGAPAGLPSNFQDYLDEQRRIAEGAAYVASLQGRASGGPVEAGKSYIVNEDTPRSEIFTPWASGYVQPQIRMPAYASVGAPVVQHVDNSTHMTTNVPPNYQTPERVALFTLKRLRAESHLAGK